MELRRGQIITSRRGRDVGRAYVVAGSDGERALLADGKKWPLEGPKPKNPRHIQPTNTILPESEWDTDDKIKKLLPAYETGRTKGG